MFKIMIIKGEMHIQHTLEMSHHCTNRDLNQHLQKKKKKTNCGVRCEGEGGGSSFDAKK